jgi:coenzyme F420 hydrogenase subunit beta
MTNVVTEIVNKDLCSSCGVCVGLCPPGALSIEFQKNGNLVPRVDAVRCLEKCHLCIDVCPFSRGFHNPREINDVLFRGFSDTRFHDNIGWYLNCIVGYRRNAELRNLSSSGGLATWCLESLLKKGMITRAAVVRFAKDRNNGFFEFYAASSVEELRASSGSAYHPVEISGIIKKIQSSKQECWAIVGVPCLCAAIRNSPRLGGKVPFVFGLACGMYQNIFYTEMLLAESGVDRENIENIEYRRKSDSGPPSDYRFRGTDNRGPGRQIAYHGLPSYLGMHAFFRLNACNFCMDVFAETADACFMDAWLPAYRKEPRGTSLVVVRNRELSELLFQGHSKGELQFDGIGCEEVCLSQKGHIRRKRELTYMRQGLQESEGSSSAKPTTEERTHWWLERWAQRRSKSAWSRYGRKYGRFAFWFALSDVLIIQNIVKYVTKMISLPKRLVGKFRRILSHNSA